MITKTTTIRELLQILGTESLRNIIHPNIHVASLFSDYKHKLTGKYYNDQKGEILELPSWIITDVRFENELEAVKQRGGITIRVNRLHNEKFLHDIALASAPFGVGAKMLEQNASYTHKSETALDTAAFKYIINNDGTIEELIEKVKKILILEKII